MRIRSIRAKNFRAIRDQTLACDDLTALVGPNGAGKSTFLHALLVFQGRQKPGVEDFYNRDTDEEIEIAVTFTDLPDPAAKKFAKYMQGGDLEGGPHMQVRQQQQLCRASPARHRAAQPRL